MMQRVGRRIGAWGRLRGWTQERLAEKVGRNASYLARIESGKRKASIDTLEVIVAALGETLGALFSHGEREDELPDGVVSALRCAESPISARRQAAARYLAAGTVKRWRALSSRRASW